MHHSAPQCTTQSSQTVTTQSPAHHAAPTHRLTAHPQEEGEGYEVCKDCWPTGSMARYARPCFYYKIDSVGIIWRGE